MRLAGGKAEIGACPHVSEEAKAALSEASAPPVRTVRVGTGASAVDLGGETVLYRHERRFVNPTAYAATVRDDLGAGIPSRIERIRSLAFERVGTVLRMDMVCISCATGDPGAYASAVGAAMAAWDGPMVLECGDPAALEPALERCAGRRPLIYGADAGSLKEMCALAKRFSCPLGLKARSPEEAAGMAADAKALGVEDVVLDLGARSLKECLERQTVARRAAIKKKFRPLGHPLMNRVGSGEYAVATAAVSTMKYGSLVVFDSLEPYEALPLFTLRQNIYTDPQVPIQVKQGLYPIGSPGPHSPVMFTTNFSLTYFTVRADVEKSKVPVWLQIVDTEGLSVLTAYAAGKFDPERVAEAFAESGALLKSDGPVIVPGLVARMSGRLQELIGRPVTVGTTESRDIPKHLRSLVRGRAARTSPS